MILASDYYYYYVLERGWMQKLGPPSADTPEMAKVSSFKSRTGHIITLCALPIAGSSALFLSSRFLTPRMMRLVSFCKALLAL